MVPFIKNPVIPSMGIFGTLVFLFLVYYIRNPRGESREDIVRFGLFMTVVLLTVTVFAEMVFEFRRLFEGGLGRPL